MTTATSGSPPTSASPDSGGLLSDPATTPSPTPFGNYRARHSVILGGVQLALGLTSVLLTAVGAAAQLYRKCRSYFCFPNFFLIFGSGYQSAIFFILAGALGVASGRRPTRCLVVAHRVLAILAASVAALHTGMAAAGVVFDWNNREGYGLASFVVNWLLVAIGLLEMVAAIWASTLGCRVTCCQSPDNRHVILYDAENAEVKNKETSPEKTGR